MSIFITPKIPGLFLPKEEFGCMIYRYTIDSARVIIEFKNIPDIQVHNLIARGKEGFI